MLGKLLGKVLAPVTVSGNSLVTTTNGGVEHLSPGATGAKTLIGNITGNSGITEDLFNNLGSGNVSGAVQSVYKDILGPGGIVNNLSDGYGLGTEALVNNVLHQADGALG